MMYRSVIFISLSLLFHSYFMAQINDNEYEGERLDTLDYWNDQLGLELKGVTLFQPLNFQTQNELRNYLILRNRTLKVYPYAKMAGERFEILSNRLDLIDKKSHRKRYIKRVEKHIFNELEDELKNLSRSQGRILIRLVYRQTGFTAFDLVKDLRSGLRAFLFQTTASLFNLTLKSEFDPINNKEDYMIEYILQRAHADGIIELQSTPLEYDLDMLYTKWNESQIPT